MEKDLKDTFLLTMTPVIKYSLVTFVMHVRTVFDTRTIGKWISLEDQWFIIRQLSCMGSLLFKKGCNLVDFELHCSHH